MQKFQDWFTQQWVILCGKRIDPKDVPWLIGPFGEIGTISDEFITQLAKEEGLTIERNAKSQGLIPSIKLLNLSELEQARLSAGVIDFYENTSDYQLSFSVSWNPFFKLFGVLVNKLFSNRIGQLNIPTKSIKDSEAIKSEIITLSDPESKKVKYTIWFRTFKSTGQVIFSGVYSICTLPDGKKCVKAVFPLPKGNATVIMSPRVGPNGELILDSSGKYFSDPGFYFLLKDSKEKYWSKNIRSFRDQLVVWTDEKTVCAEHTQSLWRKEALCFNYQIKPKQ